MAQSFYYIDPVEVTPATPDEWTDVNVSAHIPAGATGVILHVVNKAPTTAYLFGLRKNGSGDNRTTKIWRTQHFWAMIGVDANRIFEAYLDDVTDIDLLLVGYTISGVTFFTNAYPKTPDSLFDSYSEANKDADCNLQAQHGSATALLSAQGQAFTAPRTLKLNNVRLWMKKVGSPICVIRVAVYDATGTVGVDAVPTGSALRIAYGRTDVEFTTSYQLITFDLSSPLTLTEGNDYVIVVYVDWAVTINTSNYIQVGYDVSSPTHAGNYCSYSNNVFTADSGKDLCFYMYGLEWLDVDVSSECPNAKGVIIEVINPETYVGAVYSNYGLRKNGSTDDRSENTKFHCWAVIGCDESQIFEAQNGYGVAFFVVGYITSGASFFTNAVDKSLVKTGSWIDIDVSANCPDANGVFVEVYDYGTCGLRKNGSTEDIYRDVEHCWGIIEVDADKIFEGKISRLALDFFVVGFSYIPKYVDVADSGVCPAELTTIESWTTLT